MYVANSARASNASVVALLLLAGPAGAADDPVIHLFNGKDLSNFYTWLVNDHRADPDKVVAGAPTANW